MALYRKYRPATFAEVVGQEHVTDPLSIALDTGRISHAYLFSGPRGCGKTSSARILARSLNCVEGPTSKPCGVCSSCVALGPGGSGNLDVIELDAASHGGVDDTRELRDRAFYAPAESRYRVFIVDEAHMVTTAGFNALLKIVEEPPAHLIFVFATTEPDKVLPTIRSRTHHYPFRLLPPATMRGLLGKICDQEHVQVEESVYPLVIRAGGGSPRDSLSVLDQLLAGAGPDGVTYPRAVSLLGVTDVALIDDAVDALATADGSALFGTIDSVVEAGHDPRRFATDLLERLRDLILLRAVPDAAERNLVTGPGDVLERMRAQADRLGSATLARHAELLHEGLGDMRGATNPRLLLEVIAARMLLPGASNAETATLQRLEQLERRIATGAIPAATQQSQTTPQAAPQAPAAPATSAAASAPAGRRGAAALAALRAEKSGTPTAPAVEPTPATNGDAGVGSPAMGGSTVRPPELAPVSAASPVPVADSVPPQTTSPAPVQTPVAAPEAASALVQAAPAESVATHPAERAAVQQVSTAPQPEAAAAPVEPIVTQPVPAPAAVESVAPVADPVVPASIPEPVAVAEPVAEPQPVIEPELVAASEPIAVAAPVGDAMLEEIEAAWADIRAKVREFGAAVHALLSGASVSRVEGETIVFAHQHAALAQRLSQPQYVEAVQSAVRAVVGRDHGVKWEVGGAGSGGAAVKTAASQGTAAAPAAAPKKAATKFSRPSQAKAAVAAPVEEPAATGWGSPAPAATMSAAPAPVDPGPAAVERPGANAVRNAPPEDDIPLPDGPDLPDDPGLGDYSPVGYDGVPPATTPEEEREMLEQAATPVPPEERRDPDEVALALLRAELGATPLEG
ncbi:DNA polymerase III subunit gamma and tau [Nocardia sp. NPDC059240]|uniref:DNA polymerase III subunit gamma and tau n=1 Tax=Nocardia sp. NPDC059240 TaxID=3346786 RepID=UPI0036CA06D8